MTIDLFGVGDALSAEDKEYQKLKRARAKALARWGKPEDVIEGANNALGSHLQPEAQKSSNPDESQ